MSAVSLPLSPSLFLCLSLPLFLSLSLFLSFFVEWTISNIFQLFPTNYSSYLLLSDRTHHQQEQ